MIRFTQEEVLAVKRLLSYADRKEFVADLILNGYDSARLVSMKRVMRYAAGEISGSTYREDVFVVLEVMERGVELHELVGSKAVEQLISRWK
jgi:hypothetical protein